MFRWVWSILWHFELRNLSSELGSSNHALPCLCISWYSPSFTFTWTGGLGSSHTQSFFSSNVFCIWTRSPTWARNYFENCLSTYPLLLLSRSFLGEQIHNLWSNLNHRLFFNQREDCDFVVIPWMGAQRRLMHLCFHHSLWILMTQLP